MTKPRVQLKIENFGPIVEGTVEFKPLTFLIGANNSGKTYVATLLHALSRALSDVVSLPIQYRTYDLSEVPPFADGFAKSGSSSLIVDSMPTELLQAINDYSSPLSDRTETAIVEAIRQYLNAARLSDLIRQSEGGDAALHIDSTVSMASEALLRLDSSQADGQVRLRQARPERMDAPDSRVLDEMRAASRLVPLELTIDLWLSFLRDYGYGRSHSYYLPAARSGILTSWPLFASLALRNVSRSLTRHETDIAPLPGIVGEFLQIAVGQILPADNLNGYQGNSSIVQSVLDVIEGQLLGGRVVVDRSRPYSLQLMYETDKLSIPLPRASSMVSELAPIDLWVRELVEPGDLLIIDEPESHLHPENQRLIARALVRLVNAGVDVVAPTHSSTILHQVSNLLLASDMSKAAREQAGLTEADLIAFDDVAVYLFEQREDGTHIVPVPIEPGFGISEDEFVRIAEAIGDETFRFSFAAANMPA